MQENLAHADVLSRKNRPTVHSATVRTSNYTWKINHLYFSIRNIPLKSRNMLDV